MKIVDDSPPALSALDRPNSYIGRSVPRPNLQRLTRGRGQYVSDVALPRMAHVAFVRSPHAHARIVKVAPGAATKSPGVIAVVTGAELAKVMTPWVGVLTHLKGLKSAPQLPIAALSYSQSTVVQLPDEILLLMLVPLTSRSMVALTVQVEVRGLQLGVVIYAPRSSGS